MLAKLCVLIPLVIVYCGASVPTAPPPNSQVHSQPPPVGHHAAGTLTPQNVQPQQVQPQVQPQQVQPQVQTQQVQPQVQAQQVQPQVQPQQVQPQAQAQQVQPQVQNKVFIPDLNSCAKAAIRHRQCQCAGFINQQGVGVAGTPPPPHGDVKTASPSPHGDVKTAPTTTAPTDPNTTSSTVPAPDLHNCSKITVEQMNAHKGACEKITPDCLHAFNVTGLNLWCLSNLKNLEKIHSKTWKEIAAGDKEYLPVTNRAFMNIFLTRIDKYGAKGKEITEWLVKSDTLLVDALSDKTVPREALARVINSSTIANIRAAQAAKFDEKLLLALDHDAFKNISPEAFAAIPAEAFAGIDSRFLKNINPLAFSAITFAQAEKLRTTAVTGLTKEQAKNFGSTPALPPVDATGEKEKKEQEKARKEYRTGHPCYVAKGWVQMLDVRARRAINTHCGDVISAGNLTGPNLFQTMVVMFGVIVGVTLFI